MKTNHAAMSAVQRLHEQAVDLAEKAFSAQRKGDNESAQGLFLHALALEWHCASLFPATRESEPTRSVLYRSAASLAYHAQKYHHADQLIVRGLRGYPPSDIHEELRALHDIIRCPDRRVS